MATSEKRVAANRENAKKSTGPVTAAGKARAKLNAVTHGLTAQTAVLPGEDRDELEALSTSLMRQLKPRGVVQRIMAERVVSLAWKLRRVARAEEQIADELRCRSGANRFGCPHDQMTGASLLAESIRAGSEVYLFEKSDTRLARITEYELKLDRALLGAVNELLKLQKATGAFEDEQGAEPEEIANGKNEANEATEETREPKEVEVKAETPEIEPETSGPKPETSARTAPIDETNPTPSPAPDGAVMAEDAGVTGVVAGSSAPARGTCASPPPGPRR